MRVLLASEPGVDGVFRHVEALAHFLLARRHQVHLAYSDVRGSDRLARLVADVTAAGGGTVNLRVGNAPGPHDLPALAELLRVVREVRPDVIHAHSSKAGALVRALRLLGVGQPLFYTPHAYYGMAGGSGIKARVFNAVECVMGRIGTSITLSDGEAAFARRTLHIPQQRLRLIPNPVDTHSFVPAAPEVKRRLRKELGVPDGAPLLGSVGRLAFQKDPVTLYRSFAVALKKDPGLWLYHLGDGELSTECARLAEELGIAGRIIRRTYLSEPLSFYRAIDGMILASRYEGLSFAVLEALACDVPVILSEVPGNLDFIQMGLSHCWSAPKEAPDQIGAAISQWVADLPMARASNHRQTAESRFSQEACFGALVAEYAKQAAA
ncbi:MAG: glycosyltransferase [Verrucomicrobiaceae bacterium]|nr:glycosyltransferase [Verrucomicrobiaceae bacterium]